MQASKFLVAIALCVTATLAQAAGLRLIDVPADADGQALKGAMWYPCSEPPRKIDLGNITVPGVTPESVATVDRNLPANHEYHVVPNSEHLDFLICPFALGKDPGCTDAPGFDRVAFHKQFNADVLAFFRARLGACLSNRRILLAREGRIRFCLAHEQDIPPLEDR
jgi:hypothetical protein